MSTRVDGTATKQAGEKKKQYKRHGFMQFTGAKLVKLSLGPRSFALRPGRASIQIEVKISSHAEAAGTDLRIYRIKF
jgi:hypothetical protein